MQKKLSLDYKVRLPKSNIERPPLLLLLHGYGSNEEDLFSFASELPDDLLIISARAPLTITHGSYAWYTIHFDMNNGKFSDTDEALEAKEMIIHFIDELKATFSVNPKKVFLLGFSQGTILSYAVALSAPQKVSNVIALSGYLNMDLIPKDLDPSHLEQLDFFISHGAVDQVIPVSWAQNAAPFLKSLGVKHSYREYGVGHGVAPQNFYDFKTWIEQRI